MTPQERSLIDDLANKIAQANVGQKDTEAESLIQQEIGARPDSLYKLVQTVLVQNMALEQAKSQITDLQQKVATAQAHPSAPTSFLGSLFGSHSNPAPPPPPQQRGYQAAPPPGYAPPGYAPPPPGYAPQGYAPPPPGYAPPGPAAAGGGSSFLKSAATTAAGVAAGALAFEGIQSLMHGGMGGGFGHQGSGLMGGSGQPGETIVNNYYDSPQGNAGYTDDPVDQVADAGQTNDAGYDDTPVDSADDTSDDSADYSDSGDSSGGGGDDLV